MMRAGPSEMVRSLFFYVAIVVLGIGFILNFISCTIELFFSLSLPLLLLLPLSPSLSLSISCLFGLWQLHHLFP